MYMCVYVCVCVCVCRVEERHVKGGNREDMEGEISVSVCV